MRVLITTDWYTPVINGVVTSVNNPEAGLSALSDAKKRQRFGAAAQKTAYELFSAESFVLKVLQVYRNCLLRCKEENAA